MKRYKIVSRAGIGNGNEEELDDFTEEDFENFEKGILGLEKSSDLLTKAIDLVGFEYWVEEIKDK